MAPSSAASAGHNRAPPAAAAQAVPTITGTTAAVSVAGRDASNHARGAETERTFDKLSGVADIAARAAQGSLRNFLKFGLRFSRKASLPSLPSSVR